MKLKQITSHILIFALLYAQISVSFSSSAAFAQNIPTPLPIQADGSTNTQVGKTASGVDQINIAAPNSSGISHNKFSDYNINNNGQIINNFSGRNPGEIAGGAGVDAVTRTEIAGFVNVNQNLVNSGSAAIILNEVTSSRNSELRGYAEIAGSRAELIIANPNGITCNGCGFINTSRLSFIAGSSAFDANGNLNFNVRENINAGVPLVTISGLGLDASEVSSASIISSSIKLLATIYGSETNSVSLISGDGNYNYSNDSFTQNSGAAAGGSEIFAIDATNLGAVQAGRIFIIANKDGFGVNLGGDILAAKDIEIDAAGNLTYQKIAANENINISAKGDVFGKTASQIIAQNVAIGSDGNVVNYGSISGENLNFNQANLIKNFDEIAANNLTLSAFQKIENSGLIYGRNSLSLSGRELENAAAGVIYSAPSFAINLSGNLQNRGVILSDNLLNISSGGLKNYNEISALNLVLNSGNLYNESKIFAQNLVNIEAADIENAEGGVISSIDLDVIISGEEIKNSGEISSKNKVEIEFTNLENFGRLLADEVDLQGENLLNSNEILANELLIKASLDNRGDIISNYSLTLEGSQIKNSGAILAQTLTIDADELNNEEDALIRAQNVEIKLREDLVNLAQIVALSDLRVEADNLSNEGIIITGRDINIAATGALKNDGEINAGRALDIEAGSLENGEDDADAIIISTQNFDLNVEGQLTNKAAIISLAELEISAGEIANYNLINAATIKEITSDEVSNYEDGEISASSALNISKAKTIINEGKILSGGSLTLNGDLENLENKFLISAVGNIELKVAEEVKNSGEISSAQNLEIKSQSLKNESDGVITAFIVDLEIAEIENFGEISGQNLEIIAKNSLANRGNIIAGAGLNIEAQSLENLYNIVAISGDVVLSGSSLENEGVIQAREADILIEDFADVTNSNIITAKNLLEIKATENLINSGEISAQNLLKIALTDGLNNGGLLAASMVDIDAVGLLKNSGEISSKQNLNINSGDFENEEDGLIISQDADLFVVAGAKISNSGFLVAKNLLSLEAGSDLVNNHIINSRNNNVIIASENLENLGLINAKESLEIGALAVKNSGEISANNNLEIDAVLLSNLANSVIAAGDLVSINLSENLENLGDIISNNETLINAQSLENKAGATIFAELKNNISATQNLKNSGRILSYGDVILESANLENKGEALIFANNIEITLEEKLTNEAEISSANNLNIISKSVENKGLARAKNFDLIIEDLINSGEISALENLAIAANSLVNQENSIITSNEKTVLAIVGNVENSGEISSNLDLEILAGSIENDGLVIANNVEIETESLTNNLEIIALQSLEISSGALENAGAINSGADSQINISQNLNNNGQIFAQNNLDITARNLQFGSDAVVVAQNNLNLIASWNFTNGGEVYAVNNLMVNADYFTNNNVATAGEKVELTVAEGLENYGEISSNNELVIKSKSLSNQENGVIAADEVNLEIADVFLNLSEILANDVLNIKAKNFGNGAEGLIIGDDSTFTITENLTNLGDISASELVVVAANVENSGMMVAQNNSSITADVVNNEGLITADEQSLNADVIINSGEISASALLTISGENLSNSGNILSNKNLMINSDLAQNSGIIFAKEELVLEVGNFGNQALGLLASDKNLEIKAIENLLNNGEIAAVELVLNADNLGNNSLINGKNVTIEVAQSLENQGIIAGDELLINANNLSNFEDGLIASNNSLTINVIGDVENDAVISATKALALTASNLNNNFTALIFAKDLVIGDIENLENSGQIYGQNKVKILANNLRNIGEDSLISAVNNNELNIAGELENEGEISSNNKLTINANSLNNQALIISLQNLDILVAENLTNEGEISTNELTISSQKIENFGAIIAQNNSSITADEVNNEGLITAGAQILNADINNSGEISASTLLTIAGDSLSNSGNILSNQNLTINSDGIENSGVIFAKEEVVLEVDNLSNHTLGLIASDDGLQINAVEKLENDGEISGVFELVLNADSLKNYSLISGENVTLKVQSLENQGTIAGEELVINADSLKNNSTGLVFANNLVIENIEDLENFGQIYGQNSVEISALNLRNIGENSLISAVNTNALNIAQSLENEGEISSNAQLTINANSLNNEALIISLQNLDILIVENLTNDGEILAGDNLDIVAQSLANNDSALINSDNNNLNITQNLTNSGTIFAQLEQKIIANNVSNDGLISAQEKNELDVALMIFNGGEVSSADELVIAANELTNEGKIIADDVNLGVLEIENSGEISALSELNIIANNLDNNSRGLISADLANLEIVQNLNNAAEISAVNGLEIQADGLINSSGALIISRKNNILNLSGELVNSGVIAGKAVEISAQNLFNDSANSSIIADENLEISLLENIENDGEIYSGGDLKISASEFLNNENGLVVSGDAEFTIIQNLNNSGAIFADGELNIAAQNLENSGEINSVEALTITAERSVINHGNIIAGSALTLSAADLIDNYNLISAQNISEISTQNLVNNFKEDSQVIAEISAADSINISGVKNLTNNAKILAQGNLTIGGLESLDNQVTQLNNGVSIASIDGNLSIQSGEVENGATLFAGGALNISGASLKNKSSGQIISQNSSVTIVMSGALENAGEISAGEDVILAAINLVNQGGFYANNNVNLNLTGDLDNSGAVMAFNNIEIAAQNIVNSDDAIISANDGSLEIAVQKITNFGEISAGDELNLNAKEIENSAEILAQNQLVINVEKLENKLNAVVASLALNIELNAEDEIKNSGTIFANSGLVIAIDGENSQLENSGIISGNSQEITAWNLNNSGRILADENLEISASEVVNSGNINSNNNLKISAQNLENSSLILAGELLQIAVSQDLFNDEGAVIASENNLEISANSLGNFGNIVADGNLEIEAAQVYNFNLLNAFDLNIFAENIFENEGEVSANNNLVIVVLGGGIENSGKLLGGVDASLEGGFVNNDIEAAIAALAGNLNINSSGDIANSGVISAALDLEIIGEAVVNNSEILARSLNLTADDLSNYGVINAAQNIDLSLENSLLNDENSQIAAQNNLTILANNMVNNGNILAENSLNLETEELENSADSIIASLAGNVDIAIAADFTNVGNIFAKNNLTANLRNFVNEGAVSAENNLSIDANMLENNGDIAADELLVLDLVGLVNNKDIVANDVELMVGDFTNNENARLIAQNNLEISGTNLVNEGLITAQNNLNIIATSQNNLGEISAGFDLNIEVNELTNSGKILAQNDLGIIARNVDNKDGAALASLAGDLEITAENIVNSGEISAAENLNIAAINLENFSKIYAANQNLVIANSLVNVDLIYASENLTIAASDFDNRGLATAGAVSLTIDELNNSAEISGDEVEITAGEIENYAKILAQNSLTISANNIENKIDGALASLSANVILRVSEGSISNLGKISAQGNLEIAANSLENSGLITAGNKVEIASDSLVNLSEISSLNEVKISAQILENSNNILAQNLLEITAQDLMNNEDATIASLEGSAELDVGDEMLNDGLISAQDLTILNAQITNSGEISSAGDLEISSQKSLINNGAILAQENAAIEVSSLINNHQILAQNNLEIVASGNIANNNQIYAKNNLSLSGAAVENAKEILADNQITIHAATLNNNSATSLILAQDDLNIFAGVVNNQNTKPSDGNVDSGLVSRLSDVNIRADSLSNTSGIIMGNQNFLSALSAASVSLNNDLGRFISSQRIALDLGDADYAISGEITAQNIDVTARNIYNTGNVTALEYIRLFANGNAAQGQGNFNNGVDTIDNSNIALNAGTFVEISANGVINNYGTISAEENLSLTSNFKQINNYGTISGGDGVTSLTATSDGEVANFGDARITSNNDMNLSATVVTNYGEVSAARDLEINAGNNFNNLDGAITYSGRDSTFNINNILTNSWSTIYADRNLNLQKNDNADAALNKMTSLQNISGNIETYEGDINIKAVTLENKRAYMPTQGGEVAYKTVEWGAQHGGHTDLYSRVSMQGSAATIAQISSGNNLTINSSTLLNSASSISAVNDANISMASLTNAAFSFSDYITLKHDDDNVTWKYGSHTPSKGHPVPGYYYSGTYLASSDLNSYAPTGYKHTYLNGANPNDVYVNQTHSFTASIKAGGDLNGTISSQINNNEIAGHTDLSGAGQRFANIVVNGVDTYTLAESGEIDVDLSRITSAINGFSAQASSSSFTQNQQISDAGYSKSGVQVQVVESANFNNNISNFSANGAQNIEGNFSKSGFSEQNNNLSFAVRSIESGAKENLNSSNISTAQSTALSHIENPNFAVRSLARQEIENNPQSLAPTTGNGSGQVGNVDLDINLPENNLRNFAANSQNPSDINFSKSDVSAQNSDKEVSEIGEATSEFSIEKSIGEVEGLPNVGAISGVQINSPISNQSPTSINNSREVSDLDDEQTSSEIPPSNLNSADVDSNSAIKYSGNFKINLSPSDNQPVVEKRLDFTDLSRYYGSKDYFAQLGFEADAFLSELNQYNRGILNGAMAHEGSEASIFCLNNPTRCNAIYEPEANSLNTSQIYVLGDAYVETSLIRDTLAKLRNDATYLSDSETDINEEIRTLLDNSIAELNRLNIDVKDVALYGLSKEQSKLLQSDIITYEVALVNGIQALAPKIYLSQNSIDKLLGAENNEQSSLATNSSIYAKENLTINSPNADLFNSGSIKAGNNINLNVASLTNKTISFANGNVGEITSVNNNLTSATISAKNNLTITATNDIKNIASSLSANNNLSLTSTNGSILNSALISTNDKNLLDSNSDAYTQNSMRIREIADNASSLKGNINSNLLGTSTIKAGSITIDAKNDFTNLASKITAIKNTLEDDTTTSGNLSIEAGDDINIKTLELRNRTETVWGTRKNGGSSITDTVENIASNITAAGNITLQTTGTGNDTEGLEAQELYEEKEQKISRIQTQISQLNELRNRDSAPISKNFYTPTLKNLNKQIDEVNAEYQNNISELALDIGSNINVIGSDIKSGANPENNPAQVGNIIIVAKDEVNILSALNNSYSKTESHKKGTFSSKSSTIIDQEITNRLSNIEGSGDIAIISGSDTNIIASNIKGEGDGIIIAGKYLDSDENSLTHNQEIFNADAKVNIINGIDSKYHFEQHIKTSTSFNLKTALIVAVGVATGGALLIVAAGAGAAAGTEVEKTTNTSATYSETAVNSNLEFGNSLTINSASDLNIKSSNILAGLKTANPNQNAQNGDINLIAGSLITTDFNNNQTTINNNQNAKINILSAAQNSYSYNISEKLTIGLSTSDNKLKFGEMLRMKDEQMATAQSASNIIAKNGNIVAISNDDLNIKASNLITNLTTENQNNQDLGNINLASKLGNVNILSAYNQNTSSSETLDGNLNTNFTLSSRELAIRAGIEGETTKAFAANNNVVSSNIYGANLSINAGADLINPTQNQTLGNININSSNLTATRDSVSLNAANNLNLTTSSNYLNRSNSETDFSIYARAGATYNFSDVYKSIENLKDVKLESAVKYLAMQTLAADTGRIGMEIATYAPLALSGAKGDSLKESIAENQDYLRDANTIRNAGNGGSGSAGIGVEAKFSTQESKFSDSQVVMNNISANEDINLTSANADINIASSNILAENNINLSARKGDINITANTNKTNSSSDSFALNANVNIVGKGGGGGFAIADSSSASKTYINSNLVAQNQFNLNSGGDTNIISSNISANDINMLITKNLNLESRQNTLNANSDSLSLQGGFNSSKGTKSGNGSFGISNSTQNRNWVDNQASIIGSDSVIINVGNNTNINGALIANAEESSDKEGQLIDKGNLVINTKTLTYQNIYDKDYMESLGFNMGGSVRTGGAAGSGYRGTAGIGIDYAFHDIAQTTNATIGEGTIKTNAALNLDADNNLIAVEGGEELEKQESLNRNINLAQVKTKEIVINPISINYSFDFNTNEESKTANSSNSNSDESLASHLAGNANKVLSDYGNQINPLRGFGEIAFGITTDLENMRQELNVDNMIIPYREKDFRNIGETLETTRENATENLGIFGTILTTPTQLIEGTIFTFIEKKNDDEGSYAYLKTQDVNKAFNLNPDNNDNLTVNNIDLDISISANENPSNNLNSFIADNSDIYFYVKTDDVTSALKYGLNGINTDMSTGFGNYVAKNEDVVLRHNPTHGPLGDLVESELGKVADWIGQEDLIAMNRIATEDMFDRRNLEGAVNLYHSQGTIIEDGSLELYSKTFQTGVDLNGNILVDENNKPMGPQFINQSQQFNAVGPAVSENDLKESIKLIGLDPDNKSNANWIHDNLDSVLHLAAPNNLINDTVKVATLGGVEINSPIYIPNPISTLVGVILLPFIENHDVKNPSYMQFLQTPKVVEKTNFLQTPINNNLIY